jgi:hypothetical protein
LFSAVALALALALEADPVADPVADPIAVFSFKLNSDTTYRGLDSYKEDNTAEV